MGQDDVIHKITISDDMFFNCSVTENISKNIYFSLVVLKSDTLVPLPARWMNKSHRGSISVMVPKIGTKCEVILVRYTASILKGLGQCRSKLLPYARSKSLVWS